MKVTTVAFVALLADAQGQGIRLREANQAFTATGVDVSAGTDASQAPADSQGEAPPAGSLVLSPSCDGFREEAGMVNPEDVASTMEPQEAADFLCGPFGRFLLKLRVGGYMDAEDGANPCALDLKAFIEEHAALLEKIEDDESACKEEVSKAFEVLNSGPLISYDEDGKKNWGAFGAIMSVMLIGAMFMSDERLKEDIHYVGKSPSGIPVYTFKYRKDAESFLDGNVDTTSTYFGTMAQDLLDLAPDAVIQDPVDGYYRVDYSKIDVKPMKLA